MSYMNQKKMVNWRELLNDLDEMILTLDNHKLNREESIARTRLQEAKLWLEQAHSP